MSLQNTNMAVLTLQVNNGKKWVWQFKESTCIKQCKYCSSFSVNPKMYSVRFHIQVWRVIISHRGRLSVLSRYRCSSSLENTFFLPPSWRDDTSVSVYLPHLQHDDSTVKQRWHIHTIGREWLIMNTEMMDGMGFSDHRLAIRLG